MKNTSIQPLNCISKSINNTPAVVPVVTITTIKKPSGSYECIGCVNGKVITSVCSKDKAYNRREVEKALAEGGYSVPKVLAPVMSAKMPKKANRKAA